MKQLSFWILFSFISIYTFTFSQNKVLIIGIDGLRPDALIAANAPNLKALMNNSVYTLNAQTDEITVSGPSWSSMLTGVNSLKHKVTNNKFTANNLETHPHFFSYLSKKKKLVSIAHWFPINKHLAKQYADKTIFRFDNGVANRCAMFLDGAKSPDVIFLHFDAVDHAGHSFTYGPESEKYMEAIEKVDVLVGQVIEALNDRKQKKANENWLVIASTDHGGEGTGHGDGKNNPLKRNIFIFAQNDNFTSRKIEGGNIMDVTATILDFLKIDIENKIDGVSLFKQ